MPIPTTTSCDPQMVRPELPQNPEPPHGLTDPTHVTMLVRRDGLVGEFQSGNIIPNEMVEPPAP